AELRRAGEVHYALGHRQPLEMLVNDSEDQSGHADQDHRIQEVEPSRNWLQWEPLAASRIPAISEGHAVACRFVAGRARTPDRHALACPTLAQPRRPSRPVILLQAPESLEGA